jgi:hypothetical protein
LENILDALSTRRAFFKGDERLVDEVDYYVGHAERMWIMLGYLDAGRAVYVARSFAEVAAEMQQALSHVGSIRHVELKEKLTTLIVALKDYNERYGGDAPCILALPHIGWGQRLEDFTSATYAADKFGFASDDSIEAYRTLLKYLSRSCGDLVTVRTLALAVVECIGMSEMALKNRCDSLCSMISEGTKCLVMIKQRLDRSTYVIQEAIDTTDQFEARRRLLKERACSEEAVVSRLLLAIAGVRRPRAWSIRTPATTLTKVEYLGDFRIRVSFADGKTGELELSNDFWTGSYGPDFLIDPETFQSVSLDVAKNLLIWDAKLPIFLSGEYARENLKAKQST